MPNEDKGLNYFVAKKESFLVVSFLGAMTKETIAVFEKCYAEIAESKARNVVLSFHDVSEADRPAISALIRLQKQIRDSDKSIQLRLCYLKPDLRVLLMDAGALRDGELKNNLQEALISFNSIS